MYLQSRFDGFVIVLDALADGARVKEQHDEDFRGTHTYYLRVYRVKRGGLTKWFLFFCY